MVDTVLVSKVSQFWVSLEAHGFVSHLISTSPGGKITVLESILLLPGYKCLSRVLVDYNGNHMVFRFTYLS